MQKKNTENQKNTIIEVYAKLGSKIYIYCTLQPGQFPPGSSR